MNCSRRTLIVALVLVFSSLVLTWWKCWNNLFPKKIIFPSLIETRKGVIYFTEGRKPLEIKVRVLTFSGEPVIGSTVKIRNLSGGNRGSTDDAGSAVFNVSEPTIEQIIVDDQSFFGDFNSGASNHIDVSNGISILIIKN